MVTISINITPPSGMTDEEAVQLFSKNYGWTQGSEETENQFAKRILVEEVRKSILQRRKIEAQEAINIPDDVQVD